MKETQRHKEAFEYFYLELSKGLSVTDVILSVAEKYKISERTVWRWHKELDWESKTSLRDVDINDGLEDKTNTTIIDNKVKYLGIIHFSLNKYIAEVNNKTRDPIEIKDSRDLERLIKVGLLIQNQPTDIQEQTGIFRHEHEGITDVIKDPHDRATLTEIAARSRAGQTESSGSGNGDNS